MSFDVKLRKAAAHFGCKATSDAVRAACRAKADSICDSHGDDLHPEDRLLALANHYSVELRVASTTDELDDAVDQFAKQGDTGFALRRPRFDGDLIACIMRRRQPGPADTSFVALIDARGKKEAMAFFSKTHEIAHPALEPQLQFEFRDEVKKKDKWERFVDRVGADCVFAGGPWDEAVGALDADCLTISEIEELRRSVAPEASRTAVALAAGNTLRRPLFVVWAKLGTSNSDSAPVLRLRTVIPNHLAASRGDYLPPKHRVPATSPLSIAFGSRDEHSDEECLSTWTSSKGALAPRRVWTSASARKEGVLGIVVHA